jgi:uncharacterized iron-regulated protein
MRPLLLTTLLLAAADAGAHPLDGRIWDTRARAFISIEVAHDKAAQARYLLLGEKHDSEIHHSLQLEALQALDARGRKPALAMEQFDREHQAALAAAQAGSVKSAEAPADAGRLNRKGWKWPMYKALIAHAAERGWPLVAANLSHTEARNIAMGKTLPTLPAAEPAQLAAMEAEIVRSHCGQRPPDERLAAIVAAQRARDTRMAEALDSVPGPVVLIAGTGHVHRDRAVPRYLKDGDAALSIAYVETAEDKPNPTAYDTAGFDLLWFTPRTERPDPCAMPLTGSVASATHPAIPNHNKENP